MTAPLARILLVDDEPENLRALERTLRGRYDLVSCTTPAEALERLEAEEFAAIVSDQRMPGLLGTQLLEKVAILRPLTTRIILTGYTESTEMLDAINRAEIYRYVTKPWDNKELLATVAQAVEHSRLQTENGRLVRELMALNQDLEKKVDERTAELVRANEKLAELAMTDPLTKILNRRALFQRFRQEIDRAKRYDRPLAVVMIDVDHFKTFNDMEGHVLGDEALRKVAAVLQSNLRKTDVLGRYGGEEFIVLMPETKTSHALDICERLRREIERTHFQGTAGNGYLTISVGLSLYPTSGEEPEELVKAADGALYEAKAGGRNRVVDAG